MKQAGDEFYIGWQGKLSDASRRFLRNAVVLFLAGVAVLGVTLVYFQRPFQEGALSEQPERFQGIYIAKPFPALKWVSHSGGQKQVYILPMFAQGKSGVAGYMNRVAQRNGLKPDSMAIEMEATLVYNRRYACLQLDTTSGPVRMLSEEDQTRLRDQVAAVDVPLEPIQKKDTLLFGELADPKCFLGIMKPGQGKVHRDCAIRCLAGGIMPVLKTTTASGEMELFLVHHADKTPADLVRLLSDYVAQPIQIRGHVYPYYNWKVLELQDIPDIRETSRRKLLYPAQETQSCVVTQVLRPKH